MDPSVYVTSDIPFEVTLYSKSQGNFTGSDTAEFLFQIERKDEMQANTLLKPSSTVLYSRVFLPSHIQEQKRG